jgi:hypothetical protein
MRASIRKARQDAKALELLAKLGHDTSQVEITTSPEDMDRREENRTLQAEAAIQFLRRPQKFIHKQCAYSECGEFFAADYSSVAYCSWVCRNKDFEKIMGVPVDWGAKNLVERWGGEPPLIVDPITLRYLVDLLVQRNQQANQESSTRSLENLLSDSEMPLSLPQSSSNLQHEVQTIPESSPQPSEIAYSGLEDFSFDFH